MTAEIFKPGCCLPLFDFAEKLERVPEVRAETVARVATLHYRDRQGVLWRLANFRRANWLPGFLHATRHDGVPVLLAYGGNSGLEVELR